MHAVQAGTLLLATLQLTCCVGWQVSRCPEVIETNHVLGTAAAESLKQLRVSVDPGQDESSRDVLAACLRNAGVFGDVVEVPTDTSPDLVAQIASRGSTASPLPVLSAMTFGILPQWFDGQAGFVIQFTSPHGAPDLMELDCRFDSVFVYGWGSILLTPFAAFATCLWWDPEETQEFAEYVGAKLTSRARDLTDLAARNKLGIR